MSEQKTFEIRIVAYIDANDEKDAREKIRNLIGSEFKDLHITEIEPVD
ncbi:MAG: hypothetical protein AB4040_17745 [Synechococcus sp.]